MKFGKTYEDAFNLLCGHRIAQGMTRTVYDCNLNEDWVVKVEAGDVRSHFQNIKEWEVWSHVAGTIFEQCFAPVRFMSPDGRLLVMDKTIVPGRSELPTHVPAFFTDLKSTNFGMLKGRFVCHDYGTHLLMERGMTKALKKADWRFGDS